MEQSLNNLTLAKAFKLNIQPVRERFIVIPVLPPTTTIRLEEAFTRRSLMTSECYFLVLKTPVLCDSEDFKNQYGIVNEGDLLCAMPQGLLDFDTHTKLTLGKLIDVDKSYKKYLDNFTTHDITPVFALNASDVFSKMGEYSKFTKAKYKRLTGKEPVVKS